jgi:hypothetical protein
VAGLVKHHHEVIDVALWILGRYRKPDIEPGSLLSRVINWATTVIESSAEEIRKKQD